MPTLHLILLALIQGVTEFLPISSSGHLILLPQLTGAEDQGLLLDIAVHVGTLGAVILYFRDDALRAFRGLFELAGGQVATANGHLALLLLISTVPVVLAGLALYAAGLADALRSMEVIGWTMLLFGLLLWWADREGAETRQADGWLLRHALIMGLWQVLALIPGTSRSGITITGARFLGYERHGAARLAMLMSIPTIGASGLLATLDLIRNPVPGAWGEVLLAVALAFLSALAALALMMRFLARVSFTPYVIYRCLLGLVLLGLVYLG
ncbi:MAG: undecaprenyl-diphosphate phosphatase [Pseudomonadota bacterium]